MKKIVKQYKELFNSVNPLVVTVFVVSVICMNLLANKSINFPWTWLAGDCGIIMSGISFLAMDILVIKHGASASFKVSIVATLVNLFVSLMFFIASVIPGVWGESYVEGSEAIINTALDNTFGGTWFVIFGSTVAFLSSSFVNGVLNEFVGKFVKPNTKAAYYLRCYVSTVIAQFVDNLIFALIVSLNFFGWNFVQCISCSAMGAILELLFEVIFSPLGYKICKQEKE